MTQPPTEPALLRADAAVPPGPVTDPALGSAPGWPLVLYFHHVHPDVSHYTALDPGDFRRGLQTVLDLVGPAVEPTTVRPGFTPPDHPSVLFTFDDGYRDNLDLAAPILAEFDVRVLLFCVTAATDRASASDPRTRDALPPREQFLTWAEIAQLAAAGHVPAAHTHTHAKLTEVDDDTAAGEVRRSLDTVAARTGHRPRTFAYPFGLIPHRSPAPSDALAFGTVKSAPAPWSRRPLHIRRTYLPAGDTGRWRHMATGWRQQWYGSR